MSIAQSVRDRRDPDRTTDLSIGKLAAACGIAVETLRIWERRYGCPKSVRLPSSHRRYSATQVPHLRAVAEVVASGMRPSAALPMTLPALRRHVAKLAAPETPSTEAVRTALMDAIRAHEADVLRRRLRRASRALTPMDFTESVVAPLLADIGHAWACGRLHVRHEHLASQVIGDLLREVRARISPKSRAPQIVIATLPGDHHDLGAQMVAVVAAHCGYRVHMLGADTPTSEIAAAATDRRSRLVAISVALGNGGARTKSHLLALRAALPTSARLLVGGAGARTVARTAARGSGGLELITTLSEFRDAIGRAKKPLAARKGSAQ